MEEQEKSQDLGKTQTRKTVRLPKAAAVSGSFSETQTRKTVKLKPVGRPGIVLPGAGAEERTQKISVVRPAAAKASAKEDDDTPTVRIARPEKKPIGLKPVAVESAPTAPSAAESAAAPAKKRSLHLKVEKPVEEQVNSAIPGMDLIREADEEDDKPSALMILLAVAAVIVLLISAGVSLVSYLNLYEGQSISLPGFSEMK